MKTIVLIARKPTWEQAQARGAYAQSTIDSTLDEVGFIHATFPDQTMGVLPRFKDRDQVVLLLVDIDKLSAPIKYEAARSGRAGTFPHIYGALNTDAVYKTVSLEKDKNGEFIEPKELNVAKYNESFSLLQWNILYKEDIKNIVQFLKEHPADIVCLQELTINHPAQLIKDTPKYIAEQLGYHSYIKEIPLKKMEGKMMMLANGIFSRFPIKETHFAWINETTGSGGYDDEYRAYVEVTLDINGQRYYVGTTHMSYKHRFEQTTRKQQEADRLCEQLKRHSRNYIFTGDLNAVPNSYTIQAISNLLQNVGPKATKKTWTTKPFSYNGFEETELNWRLDYVFATPNIKATSSEVLVTDYSDHLPILVEFEVNKATP